MPLYWLCPIAWIFSILLHVSLLFSEHSPAIPTEALNQNSENMMRSARNESQKQTTKVKKPKNECHWKNLSFTGASSFLSKKYKKWPSELLCFVFIDSCNATSFSVELNVFCDGCHMRRGIFYNGDDGESLWERTSWLSWDEIWQQLVINYGI